MQVTVYSTKPFEVSALKKANEQHHHELRFVKEQLNKNTVDLAKGCKAVSVFSNDDLSAPVLELLYQKGVRYITLRSVGYDHVDVKRVIELGMRVANVPEYSPYSIAEHTVMLMLAMNRRLLLADKRLRQYNFELDPLVGFDMNGKTVGIIGTGKIGGVVARILHGFGCKLLGYDIVQHKALIENFNLKYVSLEEVLSCSDIITIHCPLNEHTRYMIDATAISKMKQGVMLVNTSRGAVIKTLDVFPALESGHIGYLGLDVYEHEKGLFFYDHSHEELKDDSFNRLLEFNNVLITGHQAFLTQTALQNIADTSLFNLDCFENDTPAVNELSAE